MFQVRRIQNEIIGEKLWLQENNGLSDSNKAQVKDILWGCRQCQTLLSAEQSQ